MKESRRPHLLGKGLPADRLRQRTIQTPVLLRSKDELGRHGSSSAVHQSDGRPARLVDSEPGGEARNRVDAAGTPKSAGRGKHGRFIGKGKSRGRAGKLEDPPEQAGERFCADSGAALEIAEESDVLSFEDKSAQAETRGTIGEEPAAGPDPFRTYLREVKNTPLLSHAAEIELARQIAEAREAAEALEKQGYDACPSARNDLRERAEKGETARLRLAEANLRLVISVSKRYTGHGLPLMDLIQEGNIGLLRAVDKYDYSKGFRFSTYAVWWIRHFICRALWEGGRTIRIPGHITGTLNRVSRRSAGLRQSLGREPTTGEIAEETGLSDEWISRLLRISKEPLPLEAALGVGERSRPGGCIEDLQADAPSSLASQISLREKLLQALSTLDDRERRVLSLRFGIERDRKRTLRQVARLLGVSGERVRRIEKRALRRMRRSFQRLREYL